MQTRPGQVLTVIVALAIGWGCGSIIDDTAVAQSSGCDECTVCAQWEHKQVLVDVNGEVLSSGWEPYGAERSSSENDRVFLRRCAD